MWIQRNNAILFGAHQTYYYYLRMWYIEKAQSHCLWTYSRSHTFLGMFFWALSVSVDGNEDDDDDDAAIAAEIKGMLLKCFCLKD